MITDLFTFHNPEGEPMCINCHHEWWDCQCIGESKIVTKQDYDDQIKAKKKNIRQENQGE